MNPAFICLECGSLFDTPKKYIERHGLDSPPYEEFTACPFCGGAYTTARYCDACGEPITGDYVKIDSTGDCYCDSCFILKSFDDD